MKLTPQLLQEQLLHWPEQEHLVQELDGKMVS